jgi:nicotinate-nucleotide pyrophosphorylase (carboxylating)
MNDLNALIRSALKEDCAGKDVTSRLFVPAQARAKAVLIAKQEGIICGLNILRELYRQLDKRCRVTLYKKDGSKVRKNVIIAQVTGPARSVLAGERTSLNFIQHLSGIATLTGKFASKIKGTRAVILDTRKTVPGLRALEKYAVRCGGGMNHRLNLGEMALVKDNHLKLMKDPAAAVRSAKRARPGLVIEVECETMKQVKQMTGSGAGIIMLDNMADPALRKAVRYIRGLNKGIKIEISGGVTLENVKRYSRMGVDRISVGALTHSAPAMDISMEFNKI